MEDAHSTVLDLLAGSAEAKSHASQLSFFGVYDGHGGDKVALFAGDNLHEIVKKQETFKKGDYEQALKDGFLATDRAILSGKHPRILTIFERSYGRVGQGLTRAPRNRPPL